MERYYLAYGSNLNVEQMRWRCKTARIVGTTEIQGYELLFKGSQSGFYLTIEQTPNGKVPTAVWAVTGEDEKALDRYEGYPDFYYKKEMDITFQSIKTKRKRTKKCFVYIMHEHRPLGLPSNSYLNTCVKGYRTFGFDESYLYKALNKSGRLCNEK